MNMSKRSRKILASVLVATATAGISTQVVGQERLGFRSPHVVLDARYHHDRYYPVRGYVVERLPVGAMGITFGSGQYFFHAGVWFRPVGARFEVVTPPLGIVIPALPPGYVTLTIGGSPFYYVNGVYYAPTPGAGFTVVAPPDGADMAQPVPSAGTPVPPAAAAVQPPTTVPSSQRDPVVYPRNGQSAAQTDADRQQCRQWAATQASSGGSGASVFDRALDACLDGRGYTVR